MKRTIKTFMALSVAVLLLVCGLLGLLLAPAPVALADANKGQAVGVEYSKNPDDPNVKNHEAHNGVALNNVGTNSKHALFVKHVADFRMCWEKVGFYAKHHLPKKLPKGVSRGFTRFGSHPYKGTPIVYVYPKNGKDEVHNAVFVDFITMNKKHLSLQKTLELKPGKLKAGTLVIKHYAMEWDGNKKKWELTEELHAPRTQVREIHLMKSIQKCK